MYRWDPFGEIMSLRDAMDRLVHESVVPGRAGTSSPPLEVTEDGDAYRVRLALPGVKPDDVSIQVQQNVLTVSGEFRRDEAPQGRRYLHQEHSFGSFSRSISLPGMVDTEKASAQFEHGMLTITLPKREEARPRRIPIGGSALQAGSGAAKTIEGQATSGGSMAEPARERDQQQGNQSPEERSRVEHASGFHGDKKTMPLDGETAQDAGGTSGARPHSSVAAVHPNTSSGGDTSPKR